MSQLTTQAFPDHTLESAPPASRRMMAAVEGEWGFLPAAVARLATSPHTLDGVLKLLGIFDGCTLEPLAREVVTMTIATRNGCHVCIAVHSQMLTSMEADPGLVSALRAGVGPLKDERLDAVRRFTLRVLETAGAVDDEALRDFLDHGFSAQNALEVVLGIGTYTLSTFANRLVAAPLDPPLAPFAPE
jgi:AhpD family alkylhydroperoxidase